MSYLEKKTLINFLYLYLGTVIIFLSAVGYYYFSYEKSRIVKEYERASREQKSGIISSLMKGQNCEDIKNSFIIYDANEVICDRLKQRVELVYEVAIFSAYNRVNIITKAPPRIIANGWIMIQSDDFSADIFLMIKNLCYFMVVSLLFFGISGWFLSRLILRPWSLSKKQLENFIKDATHDLKTPISSAMISLERLEQICKNDESKKYLNYASSSIKTLLLLYEDLVYINFKDRQNSRIGEIDIANIIENRLEYFEPIAKQKGIKMSFEKSSLFVKISHKDATRMIDNLLVNAIKYNRQNGHIKVEIDSKIVISDDGVGIPNEKLESIFHRFQRASDKSDGYGLGLAIVKEICDRNNIHIEVASKQNEGTTFTLTF